MSGQVDCSGCDVDVHEIVNDPTLNVTLVFVNQNLFASVENLKKIYNCFIF